MLLDDSLGVSISNHYPSPFHSAEPIPSCTPSGFSARFQSGAVRNPSQTPPRLIPIPMTSPNALIRNIPDQKCIFESNHDDFGNNRDPNTSDVVSSRNVSKFTRSSHFLDFNLEKNSNNLRLTGKRKIILPSVQDGPHFQRTAEKFPDKALWIFRPAFHPQSTDQHHN